ncbi:MAG: hypothetical protein V4555_20585 [Acidobacteriota bacterium]
MPSGHSRTRTLVLVVLLPLIAFAAMHPLVAHGCSCGHDFDFHLQSWLDAARQLRLGALYPQWAVSSAWNAGEPRYVFYPPLSWMLGALLTLLVPITTAPILFTWIALALSAWTMYRLARDYAPRNAALIAAALYAANPYMLFTAFERTSYAELLAAAWLPLLLRATLQPRPRARTLAIPLTLLWLTNDPAAVIGTYALATILLLRIALELYRKRHAPAATSGSAPLPTWKTRRSAVAINLAITTLTATILGLALPAFYLLPAAFERRYVQIALATIPNMRIQDNFLFVRTSDTAHNAVLHTASLLACSLLAFTCLVLALLIYRQARTRRNPALIVQNPLPPVHVLPILGVVTLFIAFLLTPLSLPFWKLLPELQFLQFPWRLLSLLAVVLAFSVAILFRNFRMGTLGTAATALLIPIIFSAAAARLYTQPCDNSDLPQTRAQLFATHHGDAPTDEYTPVTADNDHLSSNNPGYWLSTDPNAPAPNTLPNPALTNPTFDLADLTPEQTVSTPAPHHLAITLPQPETLLLNLRAYPAWQVTLNNRIITTQTQRDDGLLTVPLPAGPSHIDIAWRRTRDHTTGLIVSLVALLAFAFPTFRSRKIKF